MTACYFKLQPHPTHSRHSSFPQVAVGDRRTCGVLAQPFEFLTLIRAGARPGMQAEAVRFGAQGSGGLLVRSGYGSQPQHLPRRERDPLDARGILQ